MLRELIIKNRSYRRFRQQDSISEATLRELIDLGRLSASGGNMQPLKYMLSCTPEKNASIFPHLMWARLLKPWTGPAEGERPSAYIIVLLDRKVGQNAGCDHGIAAQSILLGAAERGIGGCMVGSIARGPLREVLHLDERYEILLVLALGKPGETVVMEEAKSETDVAYWRDKADVHHVPKRPLDQVIVG